MYAINKEELVAFLPEIFLLLAMLCSLLIPSSEASIATWGSIGFLQILRGAVWLLGVSVLPGSNLLRLTGLWRELSKVGRVTVSVHVSLVLVGVSTLVAYFAGASLTLLPWIIVGALAALTAVRLLRRSGGSFPTVPRISKWNALLISCVVAVSCVSLAVQVAQRYLVAGDMWVSLNPSVQILSGRNVYQAFANWEYPVTFGFVLGGLSVCVGLPVVNTYVALLPLIGLNVLSFYVMLKVVFGRTDKIASVASVLSCFGGGLALLVQLAVYHGQETFWNASFYTFDTYFAMQFWNGIQFFYKTLALTLVYTSLTVLAVSLRTRGRTRVVALFLSALLVWFSFLIHMIEVAVFVPVAVGIIYLHQTKRERYATVGIFALATAFVALSLDFLMSGYYFWLTGKKMQGFLNTVNSAYAVPMLVAGVSGVVAVVLGHRFLSGRLGSVREGSGRFGKAKLPIVLLLASIYVCGLFFWTRPSTDVSYAFPWFLYVMRYGFLGVLALVGVYVSPWRDRWFSLALLWSAVAIVMGSVWWGIRLNNFLYPMVALLAAVGLGAIWKLSGFSVHFAFFRKGADSAGRIFRVSMKPLVAMSMAVVLALSFSSFIYGTSNYLGNGPSLDDSAVEAMAWIQRNVPENASVLVPDVYELTKGVETIGDRRVCEYSVLPSTMSASSFISFTGTLQSYNIEYILTVNGTSGLTDLLRQVVACSALVLQSGETRMFRIPSFRAPSAQYSVAVVDRGQLGLAAGDAGYGWVDDEFVEGWTCRNVNASSNGEVFSLLWTFHASDSAEPSMKKTIPPVDTNQYPYVVVRYRNTGETTESARDNVGQILTLVNSSGYPAGYVMNVYLPVTNDSAFSTLSVRLPADQDVASIMGWMRNYQKRDGAIGLEIDYVGFASSELQGSSESQMQFLSMALPSLWPTDYSIVASYSEADGCSTAVSTYDKGALDYITNTTGIDSFVFLNASTQAPIWGTGWAEVAPGVVAGSFENRKITIVGTASLLEDLPRVANEIYESAFV